MGREMNARIVKSTEVQELNGICFGTLFRLKSFRRAGGRNSLGVVIAIDGGRRWDNYTRRLIVILEGCPAARFRLSPDDIEVISYPNS